MTSWFDLTTWPISLQEPEGPTGMDASVKSIHAQLDGIVAGGVPSEQIVLGGFSQGGTLSVLAGLTYPKKLAGVISISGWGAYREQLPAMLETGCPNTHTPMLYSVGTGDPIVSFDLTKKTGEILQSIMGDSVTVSHQPRGSHPPGRQEMALVEKFIADALQVKPKC